MEEKKQNELASAFIKAQAKFPQIPKNKTANIGKYTYKYADLPDILDAVIPVLNKHGLGIIQRPDGESLVTSIIHESGEMMHGTIPLPSKTSPQELGSWLTYLRRYSLTAMLGIAADEDDDAGSAQAAHNTRKNAPEAKPAPTTKGDTSKTVQGVLDGITTSENIDHQAAFEDAIHNLFDVGVGSLTGHADNPRKDMGERMARLLENVHRDRVSSITNRDEQTAFYHAMKDMVDALERTTAP